MAGDLSQKSDDELRKLLEQIGRNGEPKPGSTPAERKKTIEDILAERSAEGYRVGKDGSVTCGGQGGDYI